MDFQSENCRICSSAESNDSPFRSIYSEEDDFLILTMIEELGNVKISQDDIRSKEVCTSCLTKIKTGYDIRGMIRTAELFKAEAVEHQTEQVMLLATDDDYLDESTFLASDIKLELHQLLDNDDNCEYEYLEEEYLSEGATSAKTEPSKKDSNDGGPQKPCLEFVNIADVAKKSTAKRRASTDEVAGHTHKEASLERTQRTTRFVMPKPDVVLRTMDLPTHFVVEVKGDRCCGCSYVGVNRRELLQHSETAHSINIVGSGNYCPICFFKFNSENALTRHIDECKSKSIFVCKACQRYFNSLRKLDSHLENCKKAGITCTITGKNIIFTSEGEIDPDYADGSECQVYESDEGEDGEGDESDYDGEWEHMVYELEAEGLIMEPRFANKTTRRRRYNQTSELLHLVEDNINCCDGTKLRDIDESQVIRRIAFKTFQYIKLRGERCCVCQFKCSKRDQLFQHAKEEHEHSVDMGTGMICPICYTCFYDNKELSKHINANTSKELLVCTLCEAVFTGKGTLKFHQEYSETHRELFEQSYGLDTEDQWLRIELGDDDVIKAFDRELLQASTEKSKLRSNNRSITRHRHLTMPETKFITQIDEYNNYEAITVNGERCCGCGKFFETYNELLQHGRQMHLMENAEAIGEYQCNICFARFEWDRGLLMHRSMRRTVNKLYHCKICGLIFSKKYSIAKHLQNAPNHLASMIDKAIENNVPEDQLDQDENIAEALRLHQDARKTLGKSVPTSKYHCCLPKCGQEFANEELLIEHSTKMHGGKRRENEAERTSEANVCPGCCKSFENPTCLVWHRITRFTKQYPCRFCGQIFTRWPAYREHENVVHLGKATEFPCATCSKVFRTAQRLKAHQETHSEIRQQVCDECGASFRNKGVLKRHRRSVHANEYPFDCKSCPKKFATQEQLNAHMRVHTGAKPYTCRFCERAFSHFTDRKRHEMSSHTGERPHQCPHCPAAYIRNRELVIHMQKHTEFELEK